MPKPARLSLMKTTAPLGATPGAMIPVPVDRAKNSNTVTGGCKLNSRAALGQTR